MNAKSESLSIAISKWTGKFTKHLFEYFPNTVAVEPVLSMREALTQNLPQIEILEGSAESIPVEDESFDAVFVANAFHWFDVIKYLYLLLYYNYCDISGYVVKFSGPSWCKY